MFTLSRQWCILFTCGECLLCVDSGVQYSSVVNVYFVSTVVYTILMWSVYSVSTVVYTILVWRVFTLCRQWCILFSCGDCLLYVDSGVHYSRVASVYFVSTVVYTSRVASV